MISQRFLLAYISWLCEAIIPSFGTLRSLSKSAKHTVVSTTVLLAASGLNPQCFCAFRDGGLTRDEADDLVRTWYVSFLLAGNFSASSPEEVHAKKAVFARSQG